MINIFYAVNLHIILSYASKKVLVTIPYIKNYNMIQNICDNFTKYKFV